jgi:transcriptional regulator with XRE-family HTH domain
MNEIQHALRLAEISMSELSRRSGVSKTAILHIRDGVSKPGAKVTENLLKAFSAMPESRPPPAYVGEVVPPPLHDKMTGQWTPPQWHVRAGAEDHKQIRSLRV